MRAMRKIRVRLKDRSYDIVIGRGLLSSLGLFVKKLRIGRAAVVVTNKRVFKLYGKTVKKALEKSGVSVKFEMVPETERAKSLEIMAGLLGRISRYDRKRDLFLIALGGGVIGDLAGFTAATYKRGVPYIQIPTTLLAQVDSAIGGKTAVDLPLAKNLVGAFYQPRLVLSDVSILKSLPKRELKNGLAEIIKYGVIKDKALFFFIERNRKKILDGDASALEHIILSSSSIKRALVEKDELDKKGARAMLNYGHTLGHAIEAASAYSGRYNHGEAVAIGMIAAANIAIKMGVMKDARDAVRLYKLIASCGLPVKARGLSPDRIFSAQLCDKKHSGRDLKFILPIEIGKVRVVPRVPEAVIRSAITEMTRA
jgi:3-dehydroquinate synthase